MSGDDRAWTRTLPRRWPRHRVAVFDCDSTLSRIEGIDELAGDELCRAEIAALTDAAMAGDVPLDEVYTRRIRALRPSRRAVHRLRERYKATVVPDARPTIAALAAAGVESWVVSGGLCDPVTEFATWLGIDPRHVRAVGTDLDPLDGRWWDGAPPRVVDHDHGALTTADGKADVIRHQVPHRGPRLLIGDGASDLAASGEVDLFVAFAGVVARRDVVARAAVVVTSPSIAPVLALTLGMPAVRALLGGPHDAVARACLGAIDAGALTFNDPRTAERFEA